MTVADLINVLTTLPQDATLTELAIIRAMLLAYELGLERGRRRRMRWTETEYADYLRRGHAAPVSEQTWQRTIQRLLDQHGYAYRYHTWNSRRSPSGFPDLIAVHHLAGRPLLAID